MAWKLKWCLGGGVPALVVALFTATPIAHADAFTIVAMPDTQNYPNSGEGNTYPALQTQWSLDNRVALNIAFVTQLGDVVNTTVQWEPGNSGERHSAAMARLDGVIPYNVNQGNHDTDDSDLFSEIGACPCTKFLKVFGGDRYTAIPMVGFGGQMSATRPSFWQTFEAEGITFLIFSLEYQNWTNGVIPWAQGIIDAHPGLPVIVTAHGYLAEGGRHATIGEPLWQQLIKVNPNILMVLNGHHLGYDIEGVEYHQVSTNDFGLPVIEILANYQERPYGGDAWMQLVEFDLSAKQVNVKTYSPKYNAYEVDANSQFSVPFDMYPRLSLCNDGIDNDSDGHFDFPDDTDCRSYAGSFEGVPIALPSLTASSTALLILLLAAMGIPAMSARNRKPDACR